MRNHGSITDREVSLSTNDEIVSSSDVKGTILFCNETFCKISGFSRDELINQPHNILRHPHMPEAVFAEFWRTLKADKPWMGIVKNRCKNGDHYWVDAYITPVHEHGQCVGYESVRVKADRDRVARAEAVYRRIQQGQTIHPVWEKLWGSWSNGLVMALISFVLMALISFINNSLSIGIAGGLSLIHI